MSKNNKKSAAAAASKNNMQASVAPVATTSIAPFMSIIMDIDTNLIDRNPLNRDNFSEESLAELGASIRQYGLQTEIMVRPTADGRYQLVYGERRWRASQLEGLPTIRAKVEEMTDEKAENYAVIENMQRENYTPFEEAQIFQRMSEERGMSIAKICEDFSKNENYVRSRLNLLKLIPDVAELLNRKEITLEMAKEFANYNEAIQKEVYTQYFRNDGYGSWKGLSAKEFARRLYDKYMTKLDRYEFDKTECQTCGHNTFNQVLFTACGDCAGCQNMECLQKKNTDHLVNLAVELSTKDPRLHLAAFADGNMNVIERLTELGHEVQTLDQYSGRYHSAPEMPEEPDAEQYDDPDDMQFAMDDYNEEMEAFKQETADLEFNVSEGKTLKYAVIGTVNIAIQYEEVKEETTVEGGVTRTIAPEAPAKKLHEKDNRNVEIRNEHITSDLKKLLRCSADMFPKTEITPREEQLFYYVVLDRIQHEHKAMLGIQNCYYGNESERMQLAESLTADQKTMLMRMLIMRYCNDMNETYVKSDSIDVKVIAEFTDIHFPEQSKAVQERHQKIFDKRHESLQVRIKSLEEEAALLSLRNFATTKQLQEQPDGTFLNVETGEVFSTAQLAEMMQPSQTKEEPAIPDVQEEEPWPVFIPEPVIPEETNPQIIPWEEADEPEYNVLSILAAQPEVPETKGKRMKLSVKKGKAVA